MRQTIVAGSFYSGTEQSCRKHLERVDATAPQIEGLPETLAAAVVPHAGWDYSGRTAMKAFRVAQSHVPDGATFVLFGAVHRYGVARAAVSTEEAWETPLGPMPVDRDLSELLLADDRGLFIADDCAHATEHSLEVQLPMILHVFGERRIVPVAVPPRPTSHEVGDRVAEITAGQGREIFVVGTTDLTHYGRNYQFAPRGSGPEALEWVKSDNDRRMIDLMRELRAEEIVEEAKTRRNACGAGAVAATVAAARRMGSKGGCLVDYTTSYDVMHDRQYREMISDFVGYAGMVF